MGHVVQNYTPIENLSFDFIYIYIYICQCVIPCICMSIVGTQIVAQTHVEKDMGPISPVQ